MYEVRGEKYIELRGQVQWMTTLYPMIDPTLYVSTRSVEERVMKEWGLETWKAVVRAKELISQLPLRRDIIIPCYDVVDTSIPLSCISMIHVFYKKDHWEVVIYARSMIIDKLEEDLYQVATVLLWLLDRFDASTTKVTMIIGSLHGRADDVDTS